jgi:hypothetical protein
MVYPSAPILEAVVSFRWHSHRFRHAPFFVRSVQFSPPKEAAYGS